MKKIFLYIIGFLLLSCISLFFVTKHYINDSKIYKHNWEVSKDTMLILQDNLYLKSSEILRWKDRSKQERDSIKKIQKELGEKINYIARLEGQMNQDTIIIRDTVLNNDENYKFNFKYHDDYLSISGFTEWIYGDKFANTTITSNNISIPLTVGLTKDWKIFVKTSNPNFKITSLEGAILDKNLYLKNQPSQRRWNIGLGVGMYSGYNFNGGWYVGPGVGISLNYRIM